jgi:hypothetical protein
MPDRPPDLTRSYGEAWDVSDCDRGTPDQEATIAAWIVHLPQSRPIWPRYLFSVVHLRDMPGQIRPPYRSYPGAEYEFMIAALDPSGNRPKHPLAAADRKSWVPLTPLNVVVQFDTGRPDSEAADICRLAVQHALDGIGVEPDDNARVRPYWQALIRNTADHARGTHDNGDSL